ncbi:MAG TPA: hypothetical protein DCK98_00150 [Chloroflexi bacterium]|nr:hypothetical protein [Chloroflexota bacterium]HAL28097.1 hypothetical protein [Chloroflexota bacterium]
MSVAAFTPAPEDSAAVRSAVLARGGREVANGEIRFACPAHDDEHPSARYKAEHGVWHCDPCGAGGGFVDLAARLGVQLERRTKRTQRRIVATYSYQDEKGDLLFETVRYEPKDFRQRRPNGDGGWLWNLQGIRRVPYRLPEVRAMAAAGSRVYVVEGEKDADALDALGLCATTSPGGASKWRDEYAAYLRGAAVVVIADKDAPGRAHAQGVALSCSGTAKSVKVLELPGDAVKDASDFFSAGGTKADLERIADEAPEWVPTRATTNTPASTTSDDAEHDLTLMPSPRQPMKVAARVIDDHHRDPSLVPTLRRWRGSFYGWSGGRWAEVEDSTVHAELYWLLRDATYLDTAMRSPEIKPWAPNRYKIADLSAALGAIVHTEQDTATPSWLTRNDDDPAARELVSVGNGLLHISTRQLREHTPRLFNTVAVPFRYDPDAATPKRWVAFLGELWPDDSDARAALQEWFGYVISGDTSMHKILFLLGPLRSGKGTIARVLTSLVGNANTCGPTLASLSTNFGLQPLVGKSLAIVADARLGTANANVTVERLLSVSGEDSLTIDRKYKAHWFGKLDTRFMILSNELPAFGDASGAIASRFVVLTLTKSWLGHENHQLTGELLAEMPGILNWSLDGLDRLRSRDRFTEPASARDAIVTLQDTVSPTSAFVRDNCVLGPEYRVSVEVLYGAWRSWCEEQGRDRPGSANIFGKNLRAVVPGVRRIRPGGDDTRPYQYVGVRLRSITDRQGTGLGTNQDQVEPTDPGPVLVGPETTPLLPALNDPNAHAEPADADWIEL